VAALFGSGTLITSVRAMTEMEVLAIPCSRLRTLCSDNSEIGMHVYEAIADVLASRYKRTLAHLTTTAEGVVAVSDIWVNV
jgi:CRP-like cAMP-binding protein